MPLDDPPKFTEGRRAEVPLLAHSPTKVVLVPGTWGGAWCQPGAPFFEFLKTRGFSPVYFQGWSCDVDGLPTLGKIREGRSHANWMSGGWALRYLLEDLPLEDRNVIAHSHGGQIALYAAGQADLELNRVITVCTPVRGDLRDLAARARTRIQAHRQIYAAGWDFWMRAGEFIDGHFGWQRDMAFAHENQAFKGIGHSGLLNDPRFFELWNADTALHEAPIDFLKGTPMPLGI